MEQLETEQSQLLPLIAKDVHSEKRRRQRKKIATFSWLFMGNIGFYIGYCVLSVAMPLISNTLGYTNSEIGSIITISTAVRILPKFFSGVITDMAGGKKVFVISLLLIAVFTAIFPVMSTIWWMTFVYSLSRIVIGVTYPATMKMITAWYDYNEVGLVCAAIGTSFLFGIAYLNMLVYLGFDWQSLFFTSGATCFLSIVFAMFFLKESPVQFGLEEPAVDPANVIGDSQEEEVTPTFGNVVLSLLSNIGFWILVMYYSCIYLLRQVFVDWTPQFLRQVTGCSEGEANIGYLAFVLVGTIATFVFGSLSDRLGSHRRNISLFISSILATLAVGGLGAAVYYYGNVINVWGYIGMICVVSFVVSGPFSLPAGAMSVRYGGSKIVGTVTSFLDGFGCIASLGSGYMGDVSDLNNGWAIVCAILTGLSVLTIFFSFLYIFVDYRVLHFTCFASCKKQAEEQKVRRSLRVPN